MILAATAAWAAPVVCSPDEARTLVAEARIDPVRVPVTHPWLVPGLAWQSADDDLRAALRALCAPGGERTIDLADRWETAQWSAYTLLVTRAESRGCVLVQETVALSVGVTLDAPPTYDLRGRLPVAHTPIGDCEEAPRYREETVLAGEGEPVRLVLVEDRAGDLRTHSAVVARRATPRGWTQQVLLSPAPDRLLTGGEGPMVVLARPPGDTWVVATADRVMAPSCAPRPGQTVWTWREDRWVPVTGRDALTLLATAGLWRLAGQDGWLLVLAQDDEDDQALLDARRRRLERRRPDTPLLTLESSRFPELNPGFLIVSPGPWAERAAAEAAEATWRRRSTSYVKRAWPAANGCEGITTRDPTD